eukprot:jgi/Chlat1/4803/Chrsp31S04858
MGMGTNYGMGAPGSAASTASTTIVTAHNHNHNHNHHNSGSSNSNSSLEELKGLVAGALERRGVLAKLRAELRASVFLALADSGGDDGADGNNNSNKKVDAYVKGGTERTRSLLSTPQGKLLGVRGGCCYW